MRIWNLVGMAMVTMGFWGCFGEDSGEGNRQQNLCTGIICQNSGYCANGACVCPAQWTGPNCATQVRPASMQITSVRMNAFPATSTNGVAWDAFGGMPDVYFTVSTAGAVIYTSGMFQDLPANQVVTFNANGPVIISNPAGTYTIDFWDSDGAIDDPMGGFSFLPYSATNGFPTTIMLSGSGFSVVLALTYSF